MTLQTFKQLYKEILHSKFTHNQKDKKYAWLMTLMEQKFNIPMLRYSEWEEKNKEVIDLYRLISYSRQLK